MTLEHYARPRATGRPSKGELRQGSASFGSSSSPKHGLGTLLPTALVAVLLVLTAISGAAGLYLSIFTLVPTSIIVVLVLLGVFTVRKLGLPTSVLLPITIFFVLVGLATVISLFTTSLEFSVRGAGGLLGCVGAMCVTALACKSADPAVSLARQKYVLWVIAAISCATALWAIRQSLFGFTNAELVAINAQQSTYLVGDQIRSSGLFGVNQEFGLFSACATPAMLILAVREKRHRWIYSAAFITLAIALVISLTRTAIVAATISSLIGLILYAPGRRLAVRAVVGIFTAALIVGVAYLLLATSTDERVRSAILRMQTLLNVSDDGSFNDRLDFVWVRGVNLMMSNPFGLGAGSAGPVSSRFPDIAPAGNVTTDQGYLMIGVQVGWLGVGVFVWMLLALLIWLGRSHATAARASAMSLLALMIAMTASQYWALSAPIALVGAIFGVGVAGALLEQSQSQRPRSGSARHLPTAAGRGRTNRWVGPT